MADDDVEWPTGGWKPPVLTPVEALEFAFLAVQDDLYEVHRRAAAQAAHLADAIGFARTHPEIYAYPGDLDAVRTAERCAVTEASARLLVSEDAVRRMVRMADDARASLPILWRAAREGFVPLAQVEHAVSLLAHFTGRPAELDEFDRTVSDLAVRTSPAGFRGRATRLARRLGPLPDAEAQVDAFRHRRVVIQPVAEGMAWVNILTSTLQARAIHRRLTSTAKHATKAQQDGRTRDQHRADIAVDLLLGKGSKTAAKTKVFVTVPLDRLTPAARRTVRSTVPRPGGIDIGSEPLLDTGDPVDDDTAIRILLEEGRFTRVITDPVTGVILDMDRRSRTVTRPQREYLILHHPTCTRDGCHRPAADADIDHWIPYNSPQRGSTDERNLGALCDPDHALRDTTKIQFRRRPDLTIEMRFPTGFATRRLSYRTTPDHGDHPPF